MKNLSVKKLIGIVVGVVVALAIVTLAAVMMLRIDTAEAKQIAMDTAGGEEVISQEISSEGLWNEYSFVIVNGDSWYDIEISGFGTVTELESGTGQYMDR